MLQVTRGGIGRSAEFPKDRGNQNQVLESAKMKNISWKRKNKRKKMCIFDLEDCKISPLESKYRFSGKAGSVCTQKRSRRLLGNC